MPLPTRLVIFTKSKWSAKRVLRSITGYIEDKLYLKVNEEKTQVANVSKVIFLGYSFYVYRGIGRLRVHPKSIAKMKGRIRELTSRSNGWGNARRKEKLSSFIRGLVNYYKLADMQTLLKRIDEWYRRRLRMITWKQWKRIRTRIRHLTKLGIPKHKAWQFANTRKGYWNTAKSPILTRTITNKRLAKTGDLFFRDHYVSVKV